MYLNQIIESVDVRIKQIGKRKENRKIRGNIMHGNIGLIRHPN